MIYLRVLVCSAVLLLSSAHAGATLLPLHNDSCAVRQPFMSPAGAEEDAASAPWPGGIFPYGEDGACILRPPEHVHVDWGHHAPPALMQDYVINPIAQQSVDQSLRYLSEELKENFQVWLARSGKYLRVMKDILREEGLPEDLAYLPLIESGFNPRAYSRSRAAGPWQFIAGTGKRYGLKMDWWVDERRDPLKSTRAAARYLRDLYGMFESWPLAMAAYNAGENRIKRALADVGGSEFWDLLMTRHLKRETKDYVPKFIAARLIAVDPERHGFYGIEYEEDFVFDLVELEFPVTLDVIAKCAGTNVNEIKELNPELRRWSTPPVKSYSLRVPQGSREAFVKNLAKVPPGSRFTVRKYTVRSGDTVSDIAMRMGVSAGDIIMYNKLGSRGFIRKGQTLIIPLPLERPRRPASIKDLPSVAMGNGSSGKVYTVMRGDTVWDIARQMGVSASEIIRHNKLGRRGFITEGQKLFIPLPSTGEKEG